MRSLLLSAALFVSGLATASAATVHTPDTWDTSKKNVVFIVDVSSNTGYLLDEHGNYLPFLVATGRLQTVWYLNKKYFAKTPAATWVARQRVIQPDRVDFGVTGRFFRLFENGSTRTAYGIHGYKYFDKWEALADRYKSFGCVVVSERILDIIEDTYEANGNSLLVLTAYGPQRFLQELAIREQRAAFGA